jgi:hypothetical protein
VGKGFTVKQLPYNFDSKPVKLIWNVLKQTAAQNVSYLSQLLLQEITRKSFE